MRCTYTRGVKQTNRFTIPQNLYCFQPTCSHIGDYPMQLLERFLQLSNEEDALFYMWGHGYELDFGTKDSSYEHLKRLLDKVAGQSDVICCCNSEVFNKRKGKRE